MCSFFPMACYDGITSPVFMPQLVDSRKGNMLSAPGLLAVQRTVSEVTLHGSSVKTWMMLTI